MAPLPLPAASKPSPVGLETISLQKPVIQSPQLTSEKRRALKLDWKVIFLTSAALSSIGPILALALNAEPLSQKIEARDCYPNGIWSRKPDATWRIMHTSYFFIINLAYGSFTFSAVKIVDIIWDVVVGRGGQVILAYITYRVLNEALLFSMEYHPTSYEMFTTISFEPDSLSSLQLFFKGVFVPDKGVRKNPKRWLVILSMLLSTLYVMGFPTLVSAMTGYTTTWEAYISVTNGNLVEFSKFIEARYQIQDGSRIGFVDGYTVRANAPERGAIDNYLRDFIVDGHPLDRSSNIRINGTVYELPAPTLNITAYLPRGYVQEGANETVYPYTYITEHGSCQPGRYYQWGFSYIFLFMVSIFHCVWSFIMYCMWMETRYKSRLYREGRRPGVLRAVMDLSCAIREELGHEANYLSHKELKEQLYVDGKNINLVEKESPGKEAAVSKNL